MAQRRRRIVWTDQAREALDEVLEFVAHDSPTAARSLVEKFLQAAASLATLSERGRVVPEMEDATIRELLIQRYRLIYQVADDEVSVLAVLHGARDFAHWQEHS